MSFDIRILNVIAAFLVLMPIIDPLGSMPIILNMKAKGEKIESLRVALISFIILLVFQFAGEWVLSFLGVDIRSFAAAGAIILFLMAIEMICDIEIFKNNGPEGASSIVPLAFPLFAGPGAFAAIVAIQAEYKPMEIVIALFLIMVVLYITLKATDWVHKVLGDIGIYIIRKFFGVVLLAISVKLFAENIAYLVSYVD